MQSLRALHLEMWVPVPLRTAQILQSLQAWQPATTRPYCIFVQLSGCAVSWFLSDDLPQIPADILERLDRRFDSGDLGDIDEAERERSSMRQVVAINQQLNWRVVSLQNELHTATTNIGYLKGQVQDLVKRLHRLGYEPSQKPPTR